MVPTAALRDAGSRALGVVIPFLVAAFLGYASYVFIGLLCLQEVNHSRHLPHTSTGLIVGYCIFLGLLCFSWVLVLVYGAGTFDSIEAYKLVTFVDEHGRHLDEKHNHFISNTNTVPISNTNSNIDTSPRAIPNYFYCDANGYPYYCSACRSIKPLRARHSSELNRCVAKMDHYCIWIGSVIGKANYRSFVSFTACFVLYFVYYLVVILVFIPGQIKRRERTHTTSHVAAYLNPNIGILLFVSFLWLLILLGLLLQHLWFIYNNQTTIENLKYSRERKNRKRARVSSQEPVYVNVLYKGVRYVLETSATDKPYRKSSIFSNFGEVFGGNYYPNEFFQLLSTRFPSGKKRFADTEAQNDTKKDESPNGYHKNTSASVSTTFKDESSGQNADQNLALRGSPMSLNFSNTISVHNTNFSNKVNSPESMPTKTAASNFYKIPEKKPNNVLATIPANAKSLRDEKHYLQHPGNSWPKKIAIKQSLREKYDRWLLGESFSDEYLTALHNRIEKGDGRVFQTIFVVPKGPQAEGHVNKTL